MKQSMAMFSLITSTAASSVLKKVQDAKTQLTSYYFAGNDTSSSDNSTKEARNQWTAFSGVAAVALGFTIGAVKTMYNNFSRENLVDTVKNSLTPLALAAIADAFAAYGLVISEWLDTEDTLSVVLGLYAVLLAANDLSLHSRAKRVPGVGLEAPLIQVQDGQQPAPVAPEAKIQADLAQRLKITLKLKGLLLFLSGAGIYVGLKQLKGEEICGSNGMCVNLPALPTALGIPTVAGTIWSTVTRFTSVAQPCTTPPPAPGQG